MSNSSACARRQLKAAAFAIAALFVTIVAAPLAWADSPAQGRAHARKAGLLAAQGKCVPAVQAYTRAFEILGDPAILFNRAECLRKLGRLEDALADYERFLVEMPKPPNKPLVEQRIDGIRKRLDMPPRGPAVAAKAPAGKHPSGPSLEPKPHAAPPVAAIIDDEASDDEEEEGATAVPAWRPPGASASDLHANAADEPDERGGVSPWVWVGLGAVVVAAGVVAGFLILGKNETDVPESRLGNYQF